MVARFNGAKYPTRRALGEYDAMSLAEARDKANEWRKLIREGKDPRRQEERARCEELRKQTTTFGAVADEFIKTVLPNQRKGKVVERELRAEFISRFKDWPITDVEAADIKAVLREAMARGATYQAHNLLGHARRLFNWALAQDEYGLEKSPCDRITPKDTIGPKEPRQRTLKDEELFAIWRASGRLGYPFGTIFRLLAITGQRKSEVSGACWREFHPELVHLIRRHARSGEPIEWHKVRNEIKLWTVPPERFKSNVSHLVPLSDMVCAILANLPHFNDGDDFLFSTIGAKPVSGFSKAKSRLDRYMLRMKAAARKRGDDFKAVQLEPFVIHDLRRTLRTRLSSLRVQDAVAEMVIGHGRKGIERVYDQHKYVDEMREALTLWATRLCSIVTAKPDNVFDLSRARA